MKMIEDMIKAYAQEHKKAHAYSVAECTFHNEYRADFAIRSRPTLKDIPRKEFGVETVYLSYFWKRG